MVNKWASWCGPCRFEFPFFQQVAAKRGDEIAFLGVDANDSNDAAETFLEEFPLPYPSFSDPDDDVGKLFEGHFFPSTALYDAEGELSIHPHGTVRVGQGPQRRDRALPGVADNRGMTPRAHVSLWLILAGLLCLIPTGAGAQGSQTVPSIELSGTIDPATEKWIDAALDDAEADGAPLAIIRLDTPGGLDTSMREIVKDVIDAPMPVVVYVSPDGARAASAGAFITEAADVAAMAPQTNIGSASAVTATGGDIGGTLGRKIENDAAAFIRALTESHGRNATAGRADGHRGSQLHRRRSARPRADRSRRGERGGAARGARRVPDRGPEGADARHRGAGDRRARDAVPVPGAAAARQPDDRLPAAARSAWSGSRSRSSARG